MFDKMKQMMEFKRQADLIKRELDNVTVEVNDVRWITLVVSGNQEFRSLEVDENLLVPARKKDLERDLLRSVNAAVKKSQQVAAQKMAAAMPGLPGMM